jgi:hypothetical protein
MGHAQGLICPQPAQGVIKGCVIGIGLWINNRAGNMIWNRDV